MFSQSALLAPPPTTTISFKPEGSKASAEEILRYLLVLQEGEQGLKFSSHPQIFLETLLVKLCHYRQIVPLKDIISQVESLAKENPAPMENRRESQTSPPERADSLYQSQTEEKKQPDAPAASPDNDVRPIPVLDPNPKRASQAAIPEISSRWPSK